MVYIAQKFIFLGAMFAAGALGQDGRISHRLSRQAHSKTSQQDQSSAETGFLGGGGVENSKYFQDIYVLRPDPMEIEFGHVFENPQEWEQRYEKKDFNKNRHQGKVRWADKKGGHGEHYWDYNHAGHGGNGGQNDGDRNGGYSDQVPVYSPLNKSPKTHQKRQSEPERRVTLGDVESSPSASIFESSEKSVSSSTDKFRKEIDGIEKFDIQKKTEKQKRNSLGTATPLTDNSHLVYDLNSGRVVDDLTGKTYTLQPVY